MPIGTKKTSKDEKLKTEIFGLVNLYSRSTTNIQFMHKKDKNMNIMDFAIDKWSQTYKYQEIIVSTDSHIPSN